jgi:hypothetical protein
MTVEEFFAWIRGRLKAETLTAVGHSLGVSGVAVLYWRRGIRRPCNQTLLLADMLAHGPREIEVGLPEPDGRGRWPRRRRRPADPDEPADDRDRWSRWIVQPGSRGPGGSGRPPS